jgi:parvulin-like peptidyl-prolyl isomerase
MISRLQFLYLLLAGYGASLAVSFRTTVVTATRRQQPQQQKHPTHFYSLMAVPGSIFEDPAGWFQHKMEVMADKRQITLYHILIRDTNSRKNPMVIKEATDTLEGLKATISALESPEAQLKAFSAAASEISTDTTSAGKGGFLGSFQRGQLEINVDDAVFNGDVESVLGPVRSMYGMHLFWVAECTEA